MMRAMDHTARVLLISDDEHTARHYRGALEAVGYQVIQTSSFVDPVDTRIPDPDLILLHDLAVLSYPGHKVPIVRIREWMTPDDLVVEVHRRIGLGMSALVTSAESS